MKRKSLSTYFHCTRRKTSKSNSNRQQKIVSIKYLKCKFITVCCFKRILFIMTGIAFYIQRACIRIQGTERGNGTRRGKNVKFKERFIHFVWKLIYNAYFSFGFKSFYSRNVLKGKYPKKEEKKD